MRQKLVWLVLLTACPTTDDDSHTDTYEHTDTDTDTDVVHETGVQAYARYCSSCHGAYANGTAAGYELRHPPRDFATWVIRAGRPGDEFRNSSMPSWGDKHLDQAQLTEMFDWLDGFDRPTTGPELYADFCANCHGADASGGVVYSDIRARDTEDITAPVRWGEGDSDFGVRRKYMPAFDEQALSDVELSAIGEWLATLER